MAANLAGDNDDGDGHEGSHTSEPDDPGKGAVIVIIILNNGGDVSVSGLLEGKQRSSKQIVNHNTSIRRQKTPQWWTQLQSP